MSAVIDIKGSGIDTPLEKRAPLIAAPSLRVRFLGFAPLRFGVQRYRVGRPRAIGVFQIGALALVPAGALKAMGGRAHMADGGTEFLSPLGSYSGANSKATKSGVARTCRSI
jgi:hypothetical protein